MLFHPRQLTSRQEIAASLFDKQLRGSLRFAEAGIGWHELLTWLDTSGLALLFFAHLEEMEQLEHIPAWVQRRLARDVQNNAARMNCMADQVYSLNNALTEREVRFAMLKGFSLWPHSVSRLELRSQLDIDFLVSRESLRRSQRTLLEQGFHLHAHYGATYEYKTSADPPTNLAQLYCVHPCRSVELHVANTEARLNALNRAVSMNSDGHTIPVLAPCDLFLGQARHLYKHVCSPCVRAAHVLEFAQHIRSRALDPHFWKCVRIQAEAEPDAVFQLAFCIRFAERCLGRVAPPALSCWTWDALPDFAALWIERYATQLLAQDFPGSKLYLLLQHALQQRSAVPPRSPLRQALLPVRLPPAIARSTSADSLRLRIGRLLRQARYILLRLRFHVVSDAQLIFEWLRWRRALSTAEQMDDIVLTDP